MFEKDLLVGAYASVRAFSAPILEIGDVSAVVQPFDLEADMKPSVLVLIAENEPEIRLVLQGAFEDGGFEVVLASSGEEAIAALDDRGNPVGYI